MLRTTIIVAIVAVLACKSSGDDAAKAVAKAEPTKRAAKTEPAAKPVAKAEPAAKAEPTAKPEPVDDGYVPKKPAGAAPKIEASWIEVDQGGIELVNVPAISTDGKIIVHDGSDNMPGVELLVLRSRNGDELERIVLLSEPEYLAAKSVEDLMKLVEPRIVAAHESLGKRGWIPLLGGVITPDEHAKSGLVAEVVDGRLVIKDGDKVVHTGEAGREACERPGVHGLFRDPDKKLAYVWLSHSVDECKPPKADEHLIVRLQSSP